MNVGVCKIHFRLPGNGSLKGKRQVSRSITSRIRNRFNVAIGEVESNERHQLLVLGVSCVSNDSRHTNEVLSKVVDYVQALRGDTEILDYEIDIISGVQACIDVPCFLDGLQDSIEYHGQIAHREVLPARQPQYKAVSRLLDTELEQLLSRHGIDGLYEHQVKAIQVVSYEKKDYFTDEPLGDEVLGLPPQRFQTVALWFDTPDGVVMEVKERRLDLFGGLHAVEHAVTTSVLPLFVLCDRNDIGGVSTPLHPDTGKPQVFIYDGHAGGIGISEKGDDLIEELWTATLMVTEECPCQDGCPGCIQLPKCGNNNHLLDKAVAAMLLRRMLGCPLSKPVRDWILLGGVK